MAEPFTLLTIGAIVVTVKTYLAAHGIHIAVTVLSNMIRHYIMSGPEKAIAAAMAAGVSREIAEAAVNLFQNFDFSS